MSAWRTMLGKHFYLLSEGYPEELGIICLTD